MADHAPLVNFLSRLNTDVGAGTDKEFLAATGRRLAATHDVQLNQNRRITKRTRKQLDRLGVTHHRMGHTFP